MGNKLVWGPSEGGDRSDRPRGDFEQVYIRIVDSSAVLGMDHEPDRPGHDRYFLIEEIAGVERYPHRSKYDDRPWIYFVYVREDGERAAHYRYPADHWTAEDGSDAFSLSRWTAGPEFSVRSLPEDEGTHPPDSKQDEYRFHIERIYPHVRV